MTKKVLVVGGAGYVGSVLTRELLAKEYKVAVFDNLFFGEDSIKDIKDQIELIAGDVRTISKDVLQDVDVVINVNGFSNDPTAEYNPKVNYEVNTIAVGKLAELCKECGVKQYIFGSSCSIYNTETHSDILFNEDATVSPTAAYSLSKYNAEKILLSLHSDNFYPVILRKGTICGFSHRMRYDLVVNTFVKDALHRGYITLYSKGEMWRPIIDIKDVAKAYIICIEAEEKKVGGQIFNLAYQNYKISELSLIVKEALKSIGIHTDIKYEEGYGKIRSYKVSCEKIKKVLNFSPNTTVQESVIDMVEKIKKYNYTDFDNPKYYNIRWMKFKEGDNN